MNAMTSEPSEERPEEDSTEVVQETADAAHDAPTERPEQDSVEDNKEGESPSDEDKVTKLNDELTEFKRTFTRKTQEAAAEKRIKDTENQQLKQQLSQYQNIAKEIAQDPNAASKYATALGIDSAPKKPEEFNTVGDLVNHYDSQIQALEAKLEHKSTQSLADFNLKLRWENAYKQVGDDPVFQKYEAPIVDLIKRDKELQAMYNGSNETEILHEAKKKFYAGIEEDISRAREEEKQKVLESLKKKKAAATNTPSKSVPTNSVNAGGSLAEQVIAGVNARLSSS